MTTPCLQDMISQPPDIAFTKALPKVELHAHLTGSISRQCLHEIWLQKKVKDPEFSLEDPLRAVPNATTGEVDIASFFPIFDKYIYALVSDAESLSYAVNSVLNDFEDDGVRYLELRTTPRAIPSAGISKDDYVNTVTTAVFQRTFSGVEQGRMYSQSYKMTTRIILSVDRKNTLEEANEVVALAVKFRDSGVAGVDLCGNPARRPISHLQPAFAAARAAKIPITLHFAEIAQNGPGELQTLLSWEPQRLGHVIHVPEDLRKVIIERKLCLELCLSCNVLANLSKGGFAAHHFGEWWRAGVPIALSTDDVGIFESPLSNEYLLAAQHFGLDRKQLSELSRNAVDMMFGGEKDKKRMLGWMDEFDMSA